MIREEVDSSSLHPEVLMTDIVAESFPSSPLKCVLERKVRCTKSESRKWNQRKPESPAVGETVSLCSDLGDGATRLRRRCRIAALGPSTDGHSDAVLVTGEPRRSARIAARRRAAGDRIA